MIQFNQDAGVTTAPTDMNYNVTYCIQRLPCGYCRMLEKPCPMLPSTIEPSWAVNGPTCEATEGVSL